MTVTGSFSILLVTGVLLASAAPAPTSPVPDSGAAQVQARVTFSQPQQIVAEASQPVVQATQVKQQQQQPEQVQASVTASQPQPVAVAVQPVVQATEVQQQAPQVPAQAAQGEAATPAVQKPQQITVIVQQAQPAAVPAASQPPAQAVQQEAAAPTAPTEPATPGEPVQAQPAVAQPVTQVTIVEVPAPAAATATSATASAAGAAPVTSSSSQENKAVQQVAATEAATPMPANVQAAVAAVAVQAAQYAAPEAPVAESSAPQASTATEVQVPPASTASTASSEGTSESSATQAQVPPPEPSWLSTNFPQLYALVQGLSFALVIKALCMTGNVMVQVSPVPTVTKWYQRKDTGESDAAPYVAMAIGGTQWCFYGIFAWLFTGHSGFLILVQSNCLGSMLGTYYVIAFVRNCHDAQSKSAMSRYLSAAGGLALFQVCACALLPAERSLFLAGLVASFCSFIGAFSIMTTVPVVLRTGDTRSIPGPLVVANFLSSLVWVLCGYMLEDILVILPNSISTAVSFLCVCLKLRYPSKGDDADEDRVEEAKFADPKKKLEQTPLMESIRHRLAQAAEPHKKASSKQDIEAPQSMLANAYSAGTGGT